MTDIPTPKTDAAKFLTIVPDSPPYVSREAVTADFARDLERQNAELLEAATDAANVLAELYARYSVKIGPFASQAQKANGRLRAVIEKNK